MAEVSADDISIDFDLERVYLTLEALEIDDDQLGGSSGNGDGLLDFNETIELTLTLRNIGHLDGFGVSGELLCNSPFVEVVSGLADFGTIPAQGTGSNAVPLIFHIADDIPDAERCDFELLLSEDPGLQRFSQVAHAPAYFISVIEIDDTMTGNGDGIPDPGEVLDLRLAIENTGSSTSPALIAALASPTDYYVPSYTAYPLPELLPGDRLETEPYGIAISPDCPAQHADYLLLWLNDGAGFEVTPPFVFCTGQAFADDFEMAAGSWRHSAAPGAWSDEWHREALRNHTPGGATSWKCGGPGDWSYRNLLCAVLETAQFDLPPNAWLEFWQWIDAETSATYPGYCYDGGLLEISSDDGANWSALDPEGGYPYLIRAGSTPGPFAVETPVWSGEIDWHEVRIDLGAYSGPVKLRWVFGTDGADVREGWYLDDLRVGTGWPSATPGEPSLAWQTVRLLPARPNPATPAPGADAVRLRFALTQPASGSLAIYDATGRQVRLLQSRAWGAGVHELLWDGRDGRGRPAAAGQYYIRLNTPAVSQTRSVILVR